MTADAPADAEQGGWIQANCSVFVHQGADGPVPYIPWERLADAVVQWREEKFFDQFFFVRKPPGLRLRFAPNQGRIEPVLAAWLAEAEARNDLRGFRFGTYEPETFRFGGAAGMALAHQVFDSDAVAAMHWEILPEQDRRAVSRYELSVAVSSQLIRAVVDDGAEVWDVWCRLREAARHLQAEPLSDAVPDLAEAAFDGPPFRQRLPASVARLVEEVTDANRAAARLLRATTDAGLLTVGVRRWLAACTVFHWNRWGLPLDPSALKWLLDEMVRLTSPDAP